MQLSLTYFPAELSSSHTKWLPLKNFVLVRRISLKESQIQHNWTMTDQKVIVCRKSKELIIFSAICVATALFVMIGYFTFLSPEKKETPVENWVWNFEEVGNSTICPFLALVGLGDGYCDDEVNTPECLYDSGDCCSYCDDRTLCQDCFCYDYRLFFKNLMSFIIAIVVTHKGNTDECL